MTITLTKRQGLEIICIGLAYREEFDNLPGGDDTSFTPGQMASYGVDYRRIVRVFLRPDVLGAAFCETVCQIADEVLPVFEAARPGDTRPSAAIAAARKCSADPTEENRAAAVVAAQAAVVAAEVAADYAASGYEAAVAAGTVEAAVGAALAASTTPDAASAAAADAAEWAVAAGCHPVTVIRLIDGAGQ